MCPPVPSMNQIQHISVDGLVSMKAKIEQTGEEFVGFKGQQSAVEDEDPPATPKPLAVAEPGFSPGSDSNLPLASLRPRAASKPSSAALARKRLSPLACVPTPPSPKKRLQFLIRLAPPKSSSVAEPSLKPTSSAAFGPNPCAAAAPLKPWDDWTLTSTCCTSLAARRPRFYAPKPLSVAPSPPATVVPSSAAPRPCAQPFAPFASGASPKCSQVRFR